MREPASRMGSAAASVARIPAVVLGGLNLVRPLGIGGVRVVLATEGRHDVARSSRYVVRAVVLPPASSSDNPMLDVLLAEGAALSRRAGSRLPLFYGNDDQLHWLYRVADSLARHYLVLLNPPELGQMLIDKAKFHAGARERGILVPREFSWSNPEELAAHRGPVLIKPGQPMGWKDSPLRAVLGAPAKARVFSSGGALLEWSESQGCRDQLVVQEYVPGDDRQIYSFHGFADERSELLAWFCGRKVRTYPRSTGESSLLELVHMEELERVGREILGKFALRGPFKMDFKRDPGDGRFFLLEINARYNLWHYLGAVNGVNLPLVAYRYLLSGERPATQTYSTRYRWLNFRLDMHAFRELRGDSRASLSTVAWVRSLLAPKVCRLFSWRDPAPFFRSLALAVSGGD